ncbi:phenylalanine--tRNA ligase subunit alpha [Anaeromyxobacter paludicola]|uniref:Phenylalanine--tRNA ligase alpha subunit n=1 Tax=Anaeromyxobacter paludicola TaxID=2918171 RepID=A0ABN6N2N6_9BACT|nr:phenylalanine--tRNA ligase subunit alpha [Anaeromyxobacter paludicola]BDG07451.1 phenylalanine--tRNA ligase alpha subunit [Anaeromyxobacter paludicola]
MPDPTGQLQALAEAARTAIAAAPDERALEDLRVRYLGKKGELSQVLRGMGQLPPEERPRVGEVVNRVRDEVEGLLARRQEGLAQEKLEAELRGPALDVTLPGRRLVPRGHRHPVTRAMDDIAAIFSRLGYEVASGPEIELDWFNFEALNIPADHPARDMQDTFYVDGGTLGPSARPGVLLRTHTSPVQVRSMQRAGQPPLRVICPGRVYRSDYDQTHSPMFHQVEGLCVDRGVTFADLKGTLAAYARAFFGPGTRTRFRPSYFPFVEPGAEVDVSCSICGGTGRRDGKRCGTCKETGWLEVLGAGMVHPKVLANGGFDPAQVSGFAFGFGVERMAMLRSGIDDLRLFFENDLRFLEQF